MLNYPAPVADGEASFRDFTIKNSANDYDFDFLLDDTWLHPPPSLNRRRATRCRGTGTLLV